MINGGHGPRRHSVTVKPVQPHSLWIPVELINDSTIGTLPLRLLIWLASEPSTVVHLPKAPEATKPSREEAGSRGGTRERSGGVSNNDDEQFFAARA